MYENRYNRLNNNEYKSLNESVQRMNEDGEGGTDAKKWKGMDNTHGTLHPQGGNPDWIGLKPDKHAREFERDIFKIIRWILGG